MATAVCSAAGAYGALLPLEPGLYGGAPAGVAGALYVPQVGIINPSTFAPLFSIEVSVPLRSMIAMAVPSLPVSLTSQIF